MDPEGMIRENILRIRERIALACSRSGQDPDSITIVAVSKGRIPEEIKEVLGSGITDIGENRVQEAVPKHAQLSALPAGKAGKWHMVGHLQTNKVKEAVNIFDLIHSVDSLRLAEEIDKQAARLNKVQDILIEVKTSEEATKFGIEPEQAIKAIEDMARLKNISIRGLMTIAPFGVIPHGHSSESARPYFRTLRELKDRIHTLYAKRYTLDILSMGMTDDFEVAIEEGANMLRLGRAIFEG